MSMLNGIVDTRTNLVYSEVVTKSSNVRHFKECENNG